MSVLITAGILLLLGLWALGVYNRLIGLRRQVTTRWREVRTLQRQWQDTGRNANTSEADEDSTKAARALEHAQRLYNLVAANYNSALEPFPANIVASLTGLKRAEIIEDVTAP
jgi:hypothetical protein